MRREFPLPTADRTLRRVARHVSLPRVDIDPPTGAVAIGYCYMSRVHVCVYVWGAPQGLPNSLSLCTPALGLGHMTPCLAGTQEAHTGMSYGALLDSPQLSGQVRDREPQLSAPDTSGLPSPINN